MLPYPSIKLISAVDWQSWLEDSEASGISLCPGFMSWVPTRGGIRITSLFGTSQHWKLRVPMRQGLLVFSPVRWSPGLACLQQVGWIPAHAKVDWNKGVLFWFQSHLTPVSTSSSWVFPYWEGWWGWEGGLSASVLPLPHTSSRDSVSDRGQGGMDPQMPHLMFCAWEHGHWLTKRSDLAWRLQAGGKQAHSKQWKSSYQDITKDLGADSRESWRNPVCQSARRTPW